jgi:hypothetical protein
MKKKKREKNKKKKKKKKKDKKTREERRKEKERGRDRGEWRQAPYFLPQSLTKEKKDLTKMGKIWLIHC